MLFKTESKRERGTLSYYKNLLRQTPVTSNVMNSFDHCHEFFEKVATGYVLALALQQLNLTKVTDHIEALQEEKHLLLTSVSQHVVDYSFRRPDVEAGYQYVADDAAAKEEYGFCICREKIGGPMVECSYSKCAQGSWFHLTCKGINEAEVPEDAWYCSDSCKERASYVSDPSSNIDHKAQYSKAIIWYGLVAQCRRDAIREKDGPRMILHWRMDMLWFFELNHPKYFIHGHQLLTDIAGGVSGSLAFQLIWNRTINVQGIEGRNIAADLHMEHLNKAYKESIKAAGGNLTKDTRGRHSQMLGLHHEMTDLFSQNLASTVSHKQKSKESSDHSDVHTVLKIVQHENLLGDIPSRFHQGIGAFQFENNILKP